MSDSGSNQAPPRESSSADHRAGQSSAEALSEFLARGGSQSPESESEPGLKGAWDELLDDTPVLRRQDPRKAPKRRRVNQASPRTMALAPGIAWWNDHFLPSTWLGRGCFAASFALAWIATDRVFDPFVANAQLRVVPFLALAGWLCVAVIMFARKMPKRLRFSGAILGIAHSLLLGVSWVWELHRLG